MNKKKTADLILAAAPKIKELVKLPHEQITLMSKNHYSVDCLVTIDSEKPENETVRFLMPVKKKWRKHRRYPNLAK